MKADQTIVPESVETLPARVLMLRHEGWRLAHISATTLPQCIEISYGFDREGEYQTLRLTLQGPAPRLPSISRIYWAAFVYENELHDLFQIEVEGMVVDFQGRFIKTATPFPFGQPPGGGAQSASVPGASMTARPAASPPPPAPSN